MKLANTVSTVIPAYNAELYLAEAIDSVLSQPGSAEVIVVDDGSTDRTAEVAQSFPVRYLHQEHRGIAAARNHGARARQGAHLAFLDADDLWVPGKLRAQIEALEETRADMVFGSVVQFRTVDGKMVFEGDPQPAKLAGSMLIRSASWDDTPGFNTQWKVGEFVDWHLRASDRGLTSAMVDRTVMFRRLHESNTGKDGYGREDYVKIVKQSLDRRRAHHSRR